MNDALAERMELAERIEFGFASALGAEEARAFVQDVPRSLADADFLGGLTVEPGAPRLVRAHLPVNTPLFGRRELPFVSELHETPTGALLTPAAPAAAGRGWAEVEGEAVVGAAPEGSRVDYALGVTIHLLLPSADRWGTRALTRMIELTAASVLRNLVQRFPAAVEGAAQRAARGG